MRLRICDGERERTTPATIELVEEAFAPGVPVREGSEIAVADGDRWIAAIAVGSGISADGESDFLLSGMTSEADPPSGRVSRPEALRRFREFVLEEVRA